LMLLFLLITGNWLGRVPEAAPLLLAPWDIVMTFLSMFFCPYWAGHTIYSSI
jgi:hypothetical protein